MLGLPDFTQDIGEFKAELKAIRSLLERLVEIEEGKE